MADQSKVQSALVDFGLPPSRRANLSGSSQHRSGLRVILADGGLSQLQLTENRTERAVAPDAGVNLENSVYNLSGERSPEAVRLEPPSVAALLMSRKVTP